MRLSFGTYSIELATYTSRRELDTALQRIGGHQEFIDVANGEGSGFYALKFLPELNGNGPGSRCLGLSACRTGIEPQILPNAPSEQLFLGIDTSLLIISISSESVRRLNLGSPFYWMSLFEALDKILVVHELGLLCLDREGDTIWRFDAPDIISSVSLSTPDSLRLRMYEGGRTTVELKTGKVLNQSPK